MSTFSNQQKREIADALNSYFEDKKKELEAAGKTLSQNGLAEIVGIPASVIGYVLKADFSAVNNKGNMMVTDRILKKIKAFMGLDRSVWDTTNYELCKATFLECKLNAEQRIISGDKGMGKTFAARLFQKQYPNHTYLVTCATDQNPKQFMYEVARSIGLPTKHRNGSRYEVRVKVCEHLLAQEGSEPHLIIDETENASPAVIGAIKDIYDYKNLHERVAITVLGANDFLKMLREKAQRKVKHAFPQFISRFGAEPVELEPYSKDEATAICKLFGITEREVIKELVNKSEDYRLLNDAIKRYLSDKDLENQMKAA